MGRKRKNSDEGGVSLDSLMDALTNVVAVLILVLVLVQLDVTQKKVKFMEELEPATPEELAESKKKLEDLEKKTESIKKLLTEKPPSAEDLEAEKRQLALLEANTEERKELLAKLDELKKLEEKVRKERDSEAKKTTKIQEDIAKLEALLDTSEVANIPATEVSIPVSRDIPKSAKIYHAIVINDRIHFIDPFTSIEQFEDEFKRHKRKWLIERLKQKGTDRYIYDQTKIGAHFKDFKFSNSRQQDIQLVTNKFAARMRIVIKPDLKEGGTPLEKMNDKDSTYAKILKTLSRDSKAVILFSVHPNSFNTYLEARNMADKEGVAAGWEIKHVNQHSIVLQDVEVKPLATPPPPDPNAKPKPPGPPPIGPKLD